MSGGIGIRFSGSATIDGAPLFAPLTLDINPNEWTCLLGPSGVGKTTVLREIAALETAVDFNGNITTSDDKSLADRVAYMAQSDLLFPWLSVLENICIGAKLRGEAPDLDRATELLDRVGLRDFHTKKPKTLSGGQRQRVALARTLMEDRPVILLDEPFSALDAKTRAEMQELSAELLKGKTVLLVTHDPAEAARLGHSVFVMEQDGLQTVTMPSTPPVRAVDDPETLTAQGVLFRILRGIT